MLTYNCNYCFLRQLHQHWLLSPPKFNIHLICIWTNAHIYLRSLLFCYLQLKLLYLLFALICIAIRIKDRHHSYSSKSTHIYCSPIMCDYARAFHVLIFTIISCLNFYGKIKCIKSFQEIKLFSYLVSAYCYYSIIRQYSWSLL